MVAETKFVPRKFSKFMGDQGRSRSPSHSREHSDKSKYCGYSHGKGECRTKGQKCNKCNKMNHFARCCTEKDRQGHNAVIIATCREDKESTVLLNLYKCGTSDFLSCAFAMPDTGAQGSVSDSKLLDDLDMDLCDLDKPKHKEIVGINGSDLHPVASLTVDLELAGRRTTETITFCMDVPKFYLSRRACRALGIILKDFPNPIPLPKRKQMAAVETKKTIPMESTRVQEYNSTRVQE
jgi:hypothetical protein